MTSHVICFRPAKQSKHPTLTRRYIRKCHRFLWCPITYRCMLRITLKAFGRHTIECSCFSWGKAKRYRHSSIHSYTKYSTARVSDTQLKHLITKSRILLPKFYLFSTRWEHRPIDEHKNNNLYIFLHIKSWLMKCLNVTLKCIHTV